MSTAQPKAVLLAVPAFVLGGWAWGAVESGVAATPRSRELATVFGAMLTSVPCALLGLVFAGAAFGLRRVPWFGRITQWLARLDSSDPNHDREPVILAHAYGATAVATLLVAAGCSWLVFPALFNLQVTRLAADMAIAFTATLVFVGAIATPLTAQALALLLRRVDRRWTLPRPRSATLRFLILFTLPAFIGLYPLLERHGSLIGPVRDGLLLLLVIVSGLQLWLLLSELGALRRKLHLRTALAGIAAVIVASSIAYGRAAQGARAAEGGMLASLGGRISRALTDVDLDGTSSLYGGLDCAPLDDNRAPGRSEILDNGVDENCDGEDGKATTTAWLPSSPLAGIDQKHVRPYNIVWIVIESLRPDHMPSFGYPRPTMPYFDELARESWLFTDAWSQSSTTVFSLQSMLSGRYTETIDWDISPARPGVYGSGQPELAQDSHKIVSELLSARRYATSAVLENYIEAAVPALRRGFDQVYRAEPDNKKKNNRPRRNVFSNAHAADFLARLPPKKPFFLFMYYVDSHGAYTRHQDIDNSHFSKDEIGNYDSELAWTDETLRALVEMIRSRKSMWDNTIIVVTADHAEEFKEHGASGHGRTCHEESTHVPLLVRIPGFDPQRIDSRVGLVDIVPTLLELVGAPVPEEAGLDGQSLLVPGLFPERVSGSRPLFCSIISTNVRKYGKFFRRSVRQGDYALFQYVDEGRYALFDTREDPGEMTDLIDVAEHAERVASMKAQLQSAHTGNLDVFPEMQKAAR